MVELQLNVIPNTTPMQAEQHTSSRRTFLKKSKDWISGSWLLMQWPAVLAAADLACQAHQENAAWKVLTAEEAADLDAIAASIIPTDETPGAREAGVVHFIDHAYASFMSDDVDDIREALTAFRADIQAAHGAEAAFWKLQENEQEQVLRNIEDSDLFNRVRSLTTMGMFSHPSYGGNRDKLGWKLLGFDDRHVWAPPFGYYDDPQNV